MLFGGLVRLWSEASDTNLRIDVFATPAETESRLNQVPAFNCRWHDLRISEPRFRLLRLRSNHNRLRQQILRQDY